MCVGGSVPGAKVIVLAPPRPWPWEQAWNPAPCVLPGTPWSVWARQSRPRLRLLPRLCSGFRRGAGHQARVAGGRGWWGGGWKQEGPPSWVTLVITSQGHLVLPPSFGMLKH